ncbi:MAG: site-specific integrase [Proteobacteria bacterium]|nr:site-specific integrase [Pseudomonadota bacterium]
MSLKRLSLLQGPLLRMGEILSLTWEGVSLFRKTVIVYHSKNGERRTIPINRVVSDLLKEKTKVRLIKTNLVFYGRACTLLDDNNLRRAFRKATTKAKIENFRFHDLRHTFGFRLRSAGIVKLDRQDLLGHKSSDINDWYCRPEAERLIEAVEKLVVHEKSRKSRVLKLVS